MRQQLIPLALPLLLGGCIIQIDGWDWDWEREWVEETEELRFPDGQLQAISCRTHNGTIRSRVAAEGDEILVTVRKKAGGSDIEDAREAMAALRIQQEVEDGKLQLGWKWEGSRRSRWAAVVSFEILQPGDLALAVETHNGGVRVEGLRERVQAVTHNGTIEATLAGQDVALRTHNGHIRASLTGAGPVSGAIRTHNGSVRVRLSDEASLRLVCTTHNGRVSARRRFADVESGRNFLVGELGRSEGRLKVETHNGSITVE